MKPGALEKIKKLRETMLTPPEICVERAYLMTEAYKESEGEPEVIRRAKALDKILREITIGIEDGELIVGRGTSKKRGGIIAPEINSRWYLEEMETLSTRPWDRFAPMTEAEKETLRQCLPYWKGKALYDRWCARIPKDLLKLHGIVQFGGAYCANNQYYGHNSIDYEIVLSKGINGIQKEIEDKLAGLNMAVLEDVEKYHFLTAMNIELEATKYFARRYAALAASMAERTPDPGRKSELQKIAAICSRVPENPARTFHEALQSIWFMYLAIMMESPGPGLGFLRIDQYLYPYYKKDIEEGILTKEDALELLALLYIKVNGIVIPYPMEAAKVFGGFTLTANFTLGGLTRDGRDAVNELSYLFLEAEKEVALNSEDIIIRVHKKTPDAFVMKACEVARALRGKLKFVGDETVIQQLLHDGKPIEYARNYAITGCNSPTVPGYSLDLPGGLTNIPLMLELALNDGRSRVTGEQIGPRTGDPRNFKSYQEVWEAFKKQVEALIPACLLFRNVDKQLFAEFLPSPIQSALYHACIEKGRDVINGGTAPYITTAISLGGIPNVGDSLAAIKKLVFEEKKISMARLIDALDNNFEGYEDTWRLLQGAPKFGNNDDYVDSIVNEVILLLSNEVGKFKGFAGAVSNVALATITANIPMGFMVGALPDGRKAGEPVADGGISPHRGRNISGPTATLMSVAKLDHIRATNGSVLNMKFNPDTLKDEVKMRKFVSMIRTYLEAGGFFVQFNIVGSNTLREAQKNPEKYRDLLVRVATYSAYFVELSTELQDDIIARMEFREVY
ncbi:glycyl radical protein [Moorella sulfitireducens]|uniref:glycyl radical protein n=1 Tax=Neomoorella sulfitireducens TaxID=2972948 RepID=UPI0021AD02E8|nr:formate C-acetyltransferase/glycerol dehydratase family glycyl radical enzyme [Moorella sulfitireducens]